MHISNSKHCLQIHVNFSNLSNHYLAIATANAKYDMLNEIDKCIIRHMSEIFNFKVFQLYYVGTICI